MLINKSRRTGGSGALATKGDDNDDPNRMEHC